MPVFAKEDRPMVPGQGAEGVIVDVIETIPDYPIYTIKWFTSDGEPRVGTCGEGDLRGANPTEADMAAQHAASVNREEEFQAAVLAEGNRRLRLAAATRRARGVLKPRAVIFKSKPKPSAKRRR
jgi:hypothetical protein